MIGKRIGTVLLAGLLLAGGVLWSGTAQAWGRWGHGEGMEGAFPVLAMVNKGHLTGDQEKQVATILAGHKAALLEKSTRASDARQAMLKQITADAVDAAALGTAIDTAAAAGKDLALEWAQVRQEVQAVLTPDQMAELKQMRDKFMTKMDARHAESTQERGEKLDHWIDKLAR